MKTRKAFTLIELLIGMVIGSLVTAAAYGSFSIISDIYYKKINLANVYNFGINSLNIIIRDVRMAGYNDPKSRYGMDSISLPIKIFQDINTLNGTNGISLIYDKDQNTRIRIIYRVKNDISKSPPRPRLFRSEETCLKYDCSDLNNKISQEYVMADYIEDLDFKIYDINSNQLNSSNFTTPVYANVALVFRTQRKFNGNYISESFSTSTFIRNSGN